MQTRLALLLLGWTSLASAAGIYKWTDEQGRVHYSEHLPTHVPAQEMQLKDVPLVTAPAEDEAGRRDMEQRLLRAFDEERAQKKAQEQARREEQLTRARRCTQARERVQQYETAGSLYDMDKQGNRRTLNDAERYAAEQWAQQEVVRWCN